MKIKNLLWTAPILFGMGCASTYYPDSYTQRDVVVPPPTSTRSAVRVYPEASGTAVQTVPADEWNTAVAVRNLIAGDAYLKAAARNVDTEVIHNTAILRGTVPSEYDRQELAARIAQVPGITMVDNRLIVSLK